MVFPTEQNFHLIKCHRMDPKPTHDLQVPSLPSLHYDWGLTRAQEGMGSPGIGDEEAEEGRESCTGLMRQEPEPEEELKAHRTARPVTVAGG